MTKLPETILIGLGYETNAGKTSIARYLMQHYGFTRMSIAHKLKSVASEILDDVIDATFKNKILIRSTGREFLQKLAEFLRHELGADYFICNMNLHEMLQQHKRIVIDDVRHAQEVDYIHELGGICFNIDRPSLPHRNKDDREYHWNGCQSLWDETIRNIDISFAAELIMRRVAGEALEPLEPMERHQPHVPLIEGGEITSHDQSPEA